MILVHDHPQRETFQQQHAFFRERILPMVTAMPGFVSGNWAYDAGPSRTHSYVVFDSQGNAQKLLDHLRADGAKPAPFGVTLVSATIAEQTDVR
ncbi:MAG TPA: hypothetical protein VLB44_06145 [Kofleriaceae bacterium]|nr:hypothetical protein [Kofleriaceae bacterium]